MRDSVTISYRGARYEIGRGQRFYGIWPAGASKAPPLEWWPETPEGWSAAWARFAWLEAPDTIHQVGQPAGAAGTASRPAPMTASPVTQAADPVTQPSGALAQTGGPETQSAGLETQSTGPETRSAGLVSQPTAAVSQAVPPAGPVISQPAPPTSRPGPGALIAASLLGFGVIIGIAGLFPRYLGGSSLAQVPANLMPHVIYFAAWIASAVLILLGGIRLRLGALLALGLSVVTFGFFVSDVGNVIAFGSGSGSGIGLVLGVIGWFACAGGSVLAFLIRPARPGRPAGARLTGLQVRPRGRELGIAVMLLVGAVGTAVTFVPSWDSYTLRVPSGGFRTLTAGYAFANPGAVIAGDVVVMVTFVLAVVAAGLWRPAYQGVALLAGAAIPMAAQLISALVQLGEAVSPVQFGITPAQAAQAGLTISSGLTGWVWIYCVFLGALVLTGARMLIQSRPAAGAAAPQPAAITYGGWPTAG
ncbi:MAG TPA: hypothetical protein VGL63_09350 [Streptosporangiaceae bacterium]